MHGGHKLNIVKRIKNTISYGGIQEVIRKAFFLMIYNCAAFFTVQNIKRKKIENGLNRNKRDTLIVVSLTSFPPRFPYIGLCLKSLVMQKVKPDKIIVYLGCDTKKEQLTKEMLEFQKYGVEFRFDEKLNLMPHKKYFYAMQEYPDAIIVTADDDVVYPTNWLKELYASYKNYPDAISARRVHYIQIKDDSLLPYDHWKDQCRNHLKPSMRLIATGNAGVLYPPHCFDNEAFNVDAINELCLRTDDLWLKCMEIRNHKPVVWVKNWKVKPATIDRENNSKLQDENIFTGNNDLILKKIMSKYLLSAKDFL